MCQAAAKYMHHAIKRQQAVATKQKNSTFGRKNERLVKRDRNSISSVSVRREEVDAL